MYVCAHACVYVCVVTRQRKQGPKIYNAFTASQSRTLPLKHLFELLCLLDADVVVSRQLLWAHAIWNTKISYKVRVVAVEIRVIGSCMYLSFQHYLISVRAVQVCNSGRQTNGRSPSPCKQTILLQWYWHSQTRPNTVILASWRSLGVTYKIRKQKLVSSNATTAIATPYSKAKILILIFCLFDLISHHQNRWWERGWLLVWDPSLNARSHSLACISSFCAVLFKTGLGSLSFFMMTVIIQQTLCGSDKKIQNLKRLEMVGRALMQVIACKCLAL